MPTIMGWCSGRVEGMVKAVWAEFQGWPYLVRGLQTLLIGLVFAFLFRSLYLNWSELSTYQWSLNYLALAGSLFSLLVLTCLIRTIAELIHALIAWRR